MKKILLLLSLISLPLLLLALKGEKRKKAVSRDKLEGGSLQKRLKAQISELLKTELELENRLEAYLTEIGSPAYGRTVEERLLEIESQLENEQKEERQSDSYTREDENKIAELEREMSITVFSIEECERALEEEDGLIFSKAQLLKKENEAKSRLFAIEGAEKYLKKASEAMSVRYLDKIKSALNYYLSKADGEYSELMLDTSLSIKKREGAVFRDADAYSKGTRNLYALCLRLAITDALYTSELPFIILDDPFAHFDEKRLMASLSLLREIAKDRQIIYLTCTPNRAPKDCIL